MNGRVWPTHTTLAGRIGKGRLFRGVFHLTVILHTLIPLVAFYDTRGKEWGGDKIVCKMYLHKKIIIASPHHSTVYVNKIITKIKNNLNIQCGNSNVICVS